jgi:hypothetical protein
MNVCNKLKCLLDRLEKLARGKHSSLLRKYVNYGQNKFYKIGRKQLTEKNTLAYPT